MGGGAFLSSFLSFKDCKNKNTCYNSDMKHHYYNKRAFTLAEVLITLGIIGVVVAMTLPTLINNYRIKVLEANFKKADSVIAQAMQSTMFEYGLTRYYDFGSFCKGQYCADTKAEDYEDINNFWKTQFTGILKEPSWKEIESSHYKLSKFLGEKSNFNYVFMFDGNTNDTSKKGYLLKDGMLISQIQFEANNASEIGDTAHRYTIVPYVFIDTNGPKRGPNRMGYDLFYWIQMTCHFTSCDPISDNVRGCYLWARKDQNPYDTSVSYWKSLYKPKSYWEKLKNK